LVAFDSTVKVLSVNITVSWCSVVLMVESASRQRAQ
jgi:hypothetical protein